MSHQRKQLVQSPEPHQSDSVGLERLIFFSDAVFAIAITLLALNIHLPPIEKPVTNDQLSQMLWQGWPMYRAYLISFVVIGSFWMQHHRRFRTIRGYDGSLLLLNLFLLMGIAFVPFPTEVLNESGNRTATIFYALTMVFIGAISALNWWYTVRHPWLSTEQPNSQTFRKEMLRQVVMPGVFLLSIGIAFIDADLAKYSWLLMFIAFRFIR